MACVPLVRAEIEIQCSYGSMDVEFERVLRPIRSSTIDSETLVATRFSLTDGDGTIDHAITYDEYHDGVAADAYDAVYVCTPNALHLPYVETAAELGKDVLCEKPMEGSLERA